MINSAISLQTMTFPSWKFDFVGKNSGIAGSSNAFNTDDNLLR